LLISSLVLLLCSGHAGFSQHQKALAPGYYVVVAAFSPDHEDYAIRYSDVLAKNGIKAEYGYNTKRNYYYVYVKYTQEKQQSIAEMYQMRKQNGFEKTWLWMESSQDEPVQVTDEPLEEKINPEPIEQPPVETPISPVEAQPKVVLDSIIAKNVEEVEPVTTEVFLSIFNATNNRSIEGKIKIVDTEKAKLIKEQNGNDFLDLDPRRKAGPITLICEAFGYRKVQQEITFPMPLADTAKSFIDLVGPTFVINFDLVRYNKGDIATLYQVYFYNDAAIMLPESKFELNSLLQMMQENPGYRIRLHGHTNGNYHGRILLMGENKNFFSLDGARNTNGSAKELSEGRADIIKQYLVTNGIADSRVEVKAWGGKRPIYDKNSANAKKNVRVEVEILEDK